MVLMEFSVAPLDQGQSVSPWVARCLQLVEHSGLDYELHAMGTIVEGELSAVTRLLEACIAVVAEDSDRVSCTAKFDFRRGYTGRLQSKVQSVEQKLGRELKK